MGQLIKFGISNYLQLCVEAGFSQIQSQMYLRTYVAMAQLIDALLSVL